MDLHATNPNVEDLGSPLRHGLLTREGVDICVHPLRWTNPYRLPKSGTDGTDSRGSSGIPSARLAMRLPQLRTSYTPPPPPYPRDHSVLFDFIVKYKIQNKNPMPRGGGLGFTVLRWRSFRVSSTHLPPPGEKGSAFVTSPGTNCRPATGPRGMGRRVRAPKGRWGWAIGRVSPRVRTAIKAFVAPLAPLSSAAGH